MIETKVCGSCSKREGRPVIKSILEFGLSVRTNDGYTSSCRACNRARCDKSRKKQKEQRRLLMMTIPYRKDKVFSGPPGKTIKTVKSQDGGW